MRVFGYVLCVLLAVGLTAVPATARDKREAPGAGDVSEVQGDVVEAFLNTLPADFAVAGTNPDGSTYAGTAQMSFNRQSLTAAITWQVGADTFQGSGPLQDGQLIIDWGQDTPVIYSVNADMSLSGTWAGGRATETLTPTP